MFLVGETRHGVVRLRFEARPHDAAFGGSREDRKARARDQVVDERRQEYGLARARQAGDAEAQRPAGEIVADRAGDESRLEHEIAVTWQGKFRIRKPGAYLGGASRFGQWASVRAGLELGGRQIEREQSRVALDLLPAGNGKIERGYGAGRIFGGEAARLRVGARPRQRGRQLA